MKAEKAIFTELNLPFSAPWKKCSTRHAAV